MLVALLLAGCGGERGTGDREDDAPAQSEDGGGKAGSEGGDSTGKEDGGGFGY